MAVRTRTKYEADDGTIHQILVTPEVAAVAGAPPAGVVNSPIRAKISKTNREYGIRPRRVTLSRVIGAGDDAYTDFVTLPVLTPAAFNGAAFALGASVTYDGDEYTVATRNNEDY